jgi:hypothetical protein
MNKTKKNILKISLTGFIILFVLAFGAPVVCSNDISCHRQLGNVIYIFSSFLPLLFLSLVTYKLREETFRAWLHFAYGFVPLSIFLTFLARNSRGGSMGIPNILDQETVAFLLAALFLIISLIIIIYQWYKKLPE